MSERSIWDKLRAKGFTEKATAAVMGNWQAESGLCAYRLQGDFSDGWVRSIEYTARVDSGEISREQFIYNGPGGGGYGAAQWTFWSRKQGLYDFAKEKGTSIGDEQTAVDWFFEEVQQGEYRKTWDALMADGTIYDMTTVMLRNYEKPFDQSDSEATLRTGIAWGIYNKYSGTPEPSPEPTPEPQPTPEPTPKPIDTSEVTIPTLMIGDRDTYKGGDKGVAVAMLQMGLEKNGFSLGSWGVDGDFGDTTQKAVKAFQSECNLAVDGIVGHDTWQVLFQ